VFVRHVGELVVPGMPDLYTAMARRGVRFHYVSNSPYELLPVLNDFFQLSGLPQGSIKLKFYGGRSLFHGLWGESAADRKRGNVVEVMDNFPDSQFLLVGDTGEQDLELYTALARERPHQIAAIFLRDVTPSTPPPTAPSSPTLKPKSSSGSLRSLQNFKSMPSSRKGSLEMSPAFSLSRLPPLPSHAATDPETFEKSDSESAGNYDKVTKADIPPSPDNTRVGVLEKKELLRLRVEKARRNVPKGIFFKVFRDPEECHSEAMRVLDELGLPRESLRDELPKLKGLENIGKGVEEVAKKVGEIRADVLHTLSGSDKSGSLKGKGGEEDTRTAR